ncbi:MAG: hypothetical protein ABSF53_18140 [Terracidiphilus sp.]
MPQTLTAPSDTKAVVTDLNAGWYNVVNQAMQITDPTFQLAQGTLGLQATDSSGLFRMSDAIPAPASVSYYDPSGLSKRSAAYQLLLAALLPETGTDLAAALGDMYATWLTFRNAAFQATPPSTLTQLALFTQFANQRLDPRTAATAINTFKQAANAPLNQALDAMSASSSQQQFVDTAQQTYLLFKYSASAQAALAAINAGASAQGISFDSANMNTQLAHTTVDGAASGFYSFFSGGASASFDQLNTKAASSQIIITGYVNKYATLVTDPVGWFTSSEYMRAYAAPNNNRIWDPNGNAGSWDSFFTQPNGSLARRITSLLLVSDYEIKVTSKATYSQEDYQKITTQASFGIWPFFSGSVSTSHVTDVTQNSDSSLTFVHRLNPGLIQIWGVFTADAPN